MTHRTHVLWGLLAGLVGGILTFVYARVFIEPDVTSAIDYESDRGRVLSALSGDHEHEHEVFSRTIQQNVGAGVGTIVFSIAMGAFLGVAFTLLWSHLKRHDLGHDPRWVAAATAACLFVGFYLTPTMVYPANPPAVGDADTIGARSAAFLSITVISLLAVVAAVVLALALRPRLGGFASAAASLVAYVVVVSVAAVLLPSFDEVPTPVVDGQGRILFPGFPADTLAEFRLHSLAAQVVLWTAIAGTFAVAITLRSRRRSSRPDGRSLVNAV